jgi:Concanavalin A-like lectin/glucanases superfamily
LRVFVLTVVVLGLVSAFSVGPSASPASADYAATVLADHPVSYWRLNDSSGTTAVDQVGLNPGQITGATLGEPGPFAGSGSMRFEGNGDVNLGTDPSLRPPNNWTVEAWFKASASDTANCVNTYHGSGCALYKVHAYGLHLVLDPQGHVYGVFDSTSAQGYSVESPGTYGDDSWHHIVLVRETAQLRLYIDGSEVAATAVAEPTTFYCCENIATIANDDACRCAPLTGWESEVAFYNYPLSATRIAAHYAAAPPVPVPPPATLLAINTVAAANIGETFVTLTGTLNTYGRPAYYRFELDLGIVGSGGPSYFGFATPTQQALPVNGQQTVFATVSGLTPGTPYNFALDASGDSAFTTSTLGNILAFQTTAPPMTKKDKNLASILFKTVLGAGAAVSCVGGLLTAESGAGAVLAGVGCPAVAADGVWLGAEVSDPPSPNYTTVYTPQRFPVPGLPRGCGRLRGSRCRQLLIAAGQYMRAFAALSSAISAVGVTADRFGGATAAADLSAEDLQRKAEGEYVRLQDAALRRTRAAGKRLSKVLRQDHLDRVVSAKQAARARARLSRLQGVPNWVISRLQREGIIKDRGDFKRLIDSYVRGLPPPQRTTLAQSLIS